MRNQVAGIIKKILILFSVVLCTSATVAAQQSTCSLKTDELKDVPELFGFRLGMNFDQVKARSSLIKIGPPDQFGVVKTSISPHYEPRFDKTLFPDVRTISLDFLDGKLVTVWIGFEESFKWRDLDSFIDNFSKSLTVSNVWAPKRNGRELTCDGFSLFASIIARGPSIRVSDEGAQTIIAERREQAAAQMDAAIIGDTRNQTYYPSDCPAREAVPVTNRTVFKSKEEAEAAGYKLAAGCH